MLSLSHLKYFRDAVILGGIGAAAKRNRVTPSAISQSIKSLESHFDVDLLEHAKNQFILTNQGRTLFEQSHGIFTATDVLEDEMKASKSGLKGDVRFATQQSIAHYFLPRFLVDVAATLPNIKPQIQLGTTDVVSEWISDRSVEFGLSVDNFGEHNFNSVPIYEGHFVFVESKALPPKINKHRGFILPGGVTRESRTFRLEYKRVFGNEPKVAIEIPSWGVVKKFSETGLGVGLIPDYLKNFERNSLLREVNLDLPKIKYSINAYYSPYTNRLSRQSQTFLDELGRFVSRLKR